MSAGSRFNFITSEYLDYDEVMSKFEPFTDWLQHYINTLKCNTIICMINTYEALEMALHDRDIFRTMACMAGSYQFADSLSAIKTC